LSPPVRVSACFSVVAGEGDGRWIEYAGGYSDMLAQRAGRAPSLETGSRAQAERKPRQPPRQPSAGSSPSRKLSFKDKHALETLPRRMESLAADIARLRQKLADPTFFSRDARSINESAAELEAAERNLAAAEEEWLALELLREGLES
jgi:ATP-binding cassette subfamily F protein uup